MLTMGADCQTQTQTLVVVDPVDRKVGELTVDHSPTRSPQGLAWATRLDADRVWGVENSGSCGRGLAQFLVQQGERVSAVSPHLTGRKRRTSRERETSDPTDALAIARVV
jgi:transposase